MKLPTEPYNKIFLHRFVSLRPIILVGLYLLIQIVVSTFISLLLELEYLKKYDNIEYLSEDTGPIVTFLTVIVVGPIVETFIFQFAVIELFIRFYLKNNIILVSIIVSSLLFGVSHSYNVFAVLNSLIYGVIYAHFYWIFKLKKRNSFLFVILIHALYNFYVFIH